MIWEITAYNGTQWKASSQMSLVDALDLFYKETTLTEWDIKTIINLH